MELYNLPNDKFHKDILIDLRNASRVVLVSPFLSTKIIREWRKAAAKSNSFTIVYDLDTSLNGKEIGFFGEYDEELFSSIIWKRLKGLHSKIFYFEFHDGYSFYHGSANLTSLGVGSLFTNDKNKNIEIMSRIKDDKLFYSQVQMIINQYEMAEMQIPYFNNEANNWEAILNEDIVQGIIKEYSKLLNRLEPNGNFLPAKTKEVFGTKEELSPKVQGLFKSGNNRVIKFHTTNILEGRAEFTLPFVELKWFLGNFSKEKSTTRARKLYLVKKLDGFHDKRLIIFKVYPSDIFNLLKKSNYQRKLKVPYNSIKIYIEEDKEGNYYLKRYNSVVVLKKQQVIKL
ncbi:hypothetical protein QNH20_07850 [Neobacillus sp. WH10]|uniref:hypothetical protein n=1 Tax=Neobacillus sp. WH10 TaxID=3047873 RepID=UPI0024C1564B|nr:hypothetical protein [Neobacillus sp. WH10]WHY79032.1 hypothetical protein QNH20_07850 [Neobacillus sp. WH10]